MRLICHYCAEKGIERGAYITFHDSRGCLHVCGEHANWRLTTSTTGIDGAHHSKDCLHADTWEDRPLPEDPKIDAAFPSRSGHHDLYAEAMRLVGASHSKRRLVALVNWLLCELRVESRR